MRPFYFPITFRWSADFILDPAARPQLTERESLIIASVLDWGGWPFPIVLDNQGRVIAGAVRLEAALLLEPHFVPTVQLSALGRSDLACLEAADARLAARIGWGGDILRRDHALLAALAERPVAVAQPTPAPIEDLTPTERGQTPTTRLGDTWLLGRHVLKCSDARNVDLEKLVGEDSTADAVFFDPPQNLYRPRNEAAYLKGLSQLALQSRQALRPGGLMFAAMDWRNLQRWLRMCGPLMIEPRDLCVWVGATAPPGAFYRGACRLISCGRMLGLVHLNNGELGAQEECATNVFQFQADPGAPNSAPAALVEQLIADSTPKDALVVDLCARAGATLIAAERSDRRARLMEFSPARCDAMIRRWQDETGDVARFPGTEAPFSAVERARVTRSRK